MRRLIRLAARLYPASWRARYGAEFEALLNDMRPAWRDVFDVVRGGLEMQIRWGHAARAAAMAAGTLAVFFSVWAALHDIAHGLERDYTAEYVGLVASALGFAFLYGKALRGLPHRGRLAWLRGTGVLLAICDIAAVAAMVSPRLPNDALAGFDLPDGRSAAGRARRLPSHSRTQPAAKTGRRRYKARMNATTLSSDAPGWKICAHPLLLQHGGIFIGNDAADHHLDGPVMCPSCRSSSITRGTMAL